MWSSAPRRARRDLDERQPGRQSLARNLPWRAPTAIATPSARGSRWWPEARRSTTTCRSPPVTLPRARARCTSVWARPPPDLVEIRWPSGVAQELKNVPSDRVVKLANPVSQIKSPKGLLCVSSALERLCVEEVVSDFQSLVSFRKFPRNLHIRLQSGCLIGSRLVLAGSDPF